MKRNIPNWVTLDDGRHVYIDDFPDLKNTDKCIDKAIAERNPVFIRLVNELAESRKKISASMQDRMDATLESLIETNVASHILEQIFEVLVHYERGVHLGEKMGIV